DLTSQPPAPTGVLPVIRLGRGAAAPGRSELVPNWDRARARALTLRPRPRDPNQGPASLRSGSNAPQHHSRPAQSLSKPLLLTPGKLRVVLRRRRPENT